MIPLSSGVLNYTTIDLSNNRFNNFTILSNFLPALQLLYVYHAIAILDLTIPHKVINATIMSCIIYMETSYFK